MIFVGTDDPTDKAIVYLEYSNFPNQELLDALNLAKKIVDNIIDHPDEDKYRKINRMNPKLVANLFFAEGMHEFFLAMGFDAMDDYLVYARDDLNSLEKATKILNNRIRNFQILPKLEDHPAYKEIKKRLDEVEENKKRKAELIAQIDKNKKSVWENKKWDPAKYFPEKKEDDKDQKKK